MVSSKKNKTFSCSFFYNFASEVGNRIISLFLVGIIARHLGTKGYGELSFAFSLIYILTMLVDFGIDNILVKGIARGKKKAKELLYNALFLKFILSIFVSFLIFSITFLSKIPYPTSIAIYIIGFSFILTSIAEVFRSDYFTAIEKTKSKWILNITHRLMELFFVIFFILIGGKLIKVSIAFLLASFFNFYLSWKFARKILPPSPVKLKYGLQRWIIKASLPIGISMLFLGIYNRIDQVMLEFMKGDNAVGIYNSAYQIMEFFIFIPLGFSFIFPEISKSSRKKIKERLFFYLKWVFIITIPLSIIVGFFPTYFVNFIFGNEFQSSTHALIILIWTLPLLSLNLLLRDYFITSNRLKFSIYFFSIGATLNLLLNFLFIPHWGYRGASAATLVTEFLVLFFLISLAKLKKEKFPVRDITEKTLVSACGMTTAIHYGMRINNAVGFFGGIIAFVLLLFLQETFSKGEFQYIKESFLKE